MSNKNVFLHAPGGALVPGRKPSVALDELPPMIYDLQLSVELGPHLVPAEDGYNFNYKLYGLDDEFINRVKTAYDSTNNNLGVLLVGLKGTGKTVTAKRLCNRLGLPIIRIGFRFDGISDFISRIHQDVVIFVDEYEKCFNKSDNDGDSNDHELLKVMDGALTNEYRKVFILTSNTEHVSEYMLDRPSRIRYVRKYKNLTPEVYEEIVDDLLRNKDLKDKVMVGISKLSTITVDTVKKLIEEVNIFNQDPEDFMDYFNVKRNRTYAKVYAATYDASGKELDGRHHVMNIEASNMPSISYFGSTSLGGYLSDITGDYSVQVKKLNDYSYIHWVKLRSDITPFGPHMWSGQAFEVVKNRLTIKLYVEIHICSQDDNTYMYNPFKTDGKTHMTKTMEDLTKVPQTRNMVKQALQNMPIILGAYDPRALPEILNNLYGYTQLMELADTKPRKRNKPKAKSNSLREAVAELSGSKSTSDKALKGTKDIWASITSNSNK